MRATTTIALALSLLSAFAPAAHAAKGQASAEVTAELSKKDKAQASWEDRGVGSFTTELRLSLIGAGVTADGSVPASTDDLSAGGAGVGGSLRGGYTLLALGGKGKLKRGAYANLHIGTGLDASRILLAGDYDLGMSAGEIDPREAKDGLELDNLDLDLDIATTRQTSLSVPLVLGVNTGLGRYTSLNRFSGVGVGLAWTPAYDLGTGDIDPYSFEANLEFTRLSSKDRRGHTRLTASVSLPDEADALSSAGLSLGRVWY